MKTRGPKLEWLSLFMLLPLMAILGYMEVHLTLSPNGHMLVQLGILGLVGFLANSWISANELDFRRSQYTQKPSQRAHPVDCQSENSAEMDETQVKSTNFFARLTSFLKPIFHRG